MKTALNKCLLVKLRISIWQTAFMVNIDNMQVKNYTSLYIQR